MPVISVPGGPERAVFTASVCSSTAYSSIYNSDRNLSAVSPSVAPPKSTERMMNVPSQSEQALSLFNSFCPLAFHSIIRLLCLSLLSLMPLTLLHCKIAALFFPPMICLMYITAVVQGGHIIYMTFCDNNINSVVEIFNGESIMNAPILKRLYILIITLYRADVKKNKHLKHLNQDKNKVHQKL